MTSHPFDKLEARGKAPATVRAIESWIQQAESKVGIGAGRLSWMVASSVVVAALQRVAYDDGEPLFLLKGGTYIELRLGVRARATKDVDTLFRGSFENYLSAVDQALAEPIDGITLQRTQPQQIHVLGKLVKPQRFQIILRIRGKTWRRIAVEVSPDEGNAGARVERFSAPPLAHFGLNASDSTAGIVVDYQVAQKLHACTDPHTETYPNDRVRDVVDLLLLKAAFYQDGDLVRLRDAGVDLFDVRKKQAEETGEVPPRSWPPEVTAHPHWQRDFENYASETALEADFRAAIEELNTWITEIDNATKK